MKLVILRVNTQVLRWYIFLVSLLVSTTSQRINCLQKTTIIITGAESSVGFHVFKKLMTRKNFYPVGLVKDKAGFKTLADLGAKPDQIKVCDIGERDQLKGLFNGTYISTNI